VTLCRPVHRTAALLAFGGTVLISGCAALGPNFSAPTAWWSPKSFAPQQKAESVPVAEPVDPQWWKLLGDPQLTALEQRLLSSNLDLKLASLRLAESRAELGISRAGLLPSVNAGAKADANQQSQRGTNSLVSRSRLDDPYNQRPGH
jgi:outer membrane protein TolC